jgi:Ran GTPase-activating protein (RanGAP) involved in mRNA processing and transport
MISLEEGIEEIYHAKVTDNESEEVESEQIRFVQQVTNGLRYRTFDLSFQQCGLNVLARIPKIFRLLPNVRTLQLYNNLIRDGGVQKVHLLIQSNRQIVNLDIGANNLTDGSLMCLLEIIRNTAVQSLQIGRREETLQENRYSKEALMIIFDVIAECNSLRSFGIAGIGAARQTTAFRTRKFSRRLADLLIKGTKLENIDISSSDLVDQDQSLLAEGFMSNANLKYLRIANNSFPNGCKLVDGICHLDKLRLLDLSNCEIHENACEIVTSRFTDGWGLITLNLSRNPIGTTAVSHLLQVLCTNDTLVELNLSETGAESVIAEDLKAFLQATMTLRDLDLSKNNLGDAVAFVFADVLSSQDTLVNLWLASCHMTDDGALSMCKSLVENSTLKKLDLKDNFLSAPGGFDLTAFLQGNETLRSVDLTSTQIDYFALEAVEEIMKRNRQSARDKHLRDLRRTYVRLTIQKSKIPPLEEQLAGLNDRNEELSSQIGTLTDKINAYDNETFGTLDLLKKSIDELEKMIETENEQMGKMREAIEKMHEEKETFLQETKAKTEKEDELFHKIEEEAAKVEAATVQFNQDVLDQKTKYEKDIHLVESMMDEIIDMMSNPTAFRHYEIPAYPFPEELIPVVTAHSGDPSQVQSRKVSVDDLAPLSPKSLPRNNAKPKVARPVTAIGKR